MRLLPMRGRPNLASQKAPSCRGNKLRVQLPPCLSHSLTASCCYTQGFLFFCWLFLKPPIGSHSSWLKDVFFFSYQPFCGFNLRCTSSISNMFQNVSVFSLKCLRNIAVFLADSSNTVAFPLSASPDQVCCISSAESSHNTSSKLWYFLRYIYEHLSPAVTCSHDNVCISHVFATLTAFG